MKINVDKNNKDQFYRYKMAFPEIKVEGKGAASKTVILNMTEIADALKRNTDHIVRLIGQELGTQTKIDKKNDRCILNGSHDPKTILSLIYFFVENYVLCGKCRNPETFYVAKEKGLRRECYACGNKTKTEGKLVNAIMKEIKEKGSKDSYTTISQSTIIIENDNLVIEEFFCSTFDFLEDLPRIKKNVKNKKSMLSGLELYLVRMNEEESVCRYLDMLIKENCVVKEDIHEYFSQKSNVIDRSASNSIRMFLKSYFEDF